MEKKTIVRALLAGAAGVAAMTLAEKLEQRFTRRPDSYIPAHTLQRLLKRPENDNLGANWAMHWGQGILLGAARGWMAEHGVRGPFASFLFLNVRLLNDQSLENLTGAGAPPWRWPVDEQAIDIAEKAVYALITGYVADWLIQSKNGGPRQRQPWPQRPVS